MPGLIGVINFRIDVRQGGMSLIVQRQLHMHSAGRDKVTAK